MMRRELLYAGSSGSNTDARSMYSHVSSRLPAMSYDSASSHSTHGETISRSSRRAHAQSNRPSLFNVFALADQLVRLTDQQLQRLMPARDDAAAKFFDDVATAEED
jgi:hypothetical protein